MWNRVRLYPAIDRPVATVNVRSWEAAVAAEALVGVASAPPADSTPRSLHPPTATVATSAAANRARFRGRTSSSLSGRSRPAGGRRPAGDRAITPYPGQA